MRIAAIAAIGIWVGSDPPVALSLSALHVCPGIFAALADHAGGKGIRRGAAVWAKDAVRSSGEGAESSDGLTCKSACV